MVTVVDCSSFEEYWDSRETLIEKEVALGQNDKRSLVDLINDQIEFSDVILLNKVDLIDSKKLRRIKGSVRAINAEAKIIETKESKVMLKEVLGTRLFNMEKARQSPGWSKSFKRRGIIRN